MSMEGFPFVYDVNNNNHNGWGHWGGSLIGGLVGGAVGSAWTGNRWNYGPAQPYGYPGFGNAVGVANLTGENFIMDTLTGIGNNVTNNARDSASQSASLQSALCQGFSGVNATIQQVGANIAQNQSRAEAAVAVANLQNQISQKDNEIAGLNRSFNAQVQGMNDSFALQTAIKDCCCTTNRNIETQGCETRAAIHAEGEATRALVSQLDRERLLRENCAKDAEIAALKSQQFCNATAQAAAENVIKHFYASRTTTTTGAAA